MSTLLGMPVVQPWRPGRGGGPGAMSGVGLLSPVLRPSLNDRCLLCFPPQALLAPSGEKGGRWRFTSQPAVGTERDSAG